MLPPLRGGVGNRERQERIRINLDNGQLYFTYSEPIISEGNLIHIISETVISIAIFSIQAVLSNKKFLMVMNK